MLSEDNIITFTAVNNEFRKWTEHTMTHAHMQRSCIEMVCDWEHSR
uniref:Uncharacterized protein n=1 Tax=Rhizophora mucronata TaxID=61149 RepID=A0A2P2Q2I2_RHIMU